MHQYTSVSRWTWQLLIERFSAIHWSFVSLKFCFIFLPFMNNFTCVLTLSLRITSFEYPDNDGFSRLCDNWKSLQTTILNLMKMAGLLRKGRKHWKKKKLLVTSNFSFFHSVFKRCHFCCRWRDFSERVENTVEKEEIACYKQFLLFP